MSLLFVNQIRQYLQAAKNFKINNINKWLNEKHVLCKSEQILMEVKLEPKFSKRAGIKPCYRLCTRSFIQLCSAGRNSAFQVLQSTPGVPDTARHKGIEHPLEDHLCCSVIKHASWNSFSSFELHISRQGSQWALWVYLVCMVRFW